MLAFEQRAKELQLTDRHSWNHSASKKEEAGSSPQSLGNSASHFLQTSQARSLLSLQCPCGCLVKSCWLKFEPACNGRAQAGAAPNCVSDGSRGGASAKLVPADDFMRRLAYSCRDGRDGRDGCCTDCLAPHEAPRSQAVQALLQRMLRRKCSFEA